MWGFIKVKKKTALVFLHLLHAQTFTLKSTKFYTSGVLLQSSSIKSLFLLARKVQSPGPDSVTKDNMFTGGTNCKNVWLKG